MSNKPEHVKCSNCVFVLNDLPIGIYCYYDNKFVEKESHDFCHNFSEEWPESNTELMAELQKSCDGIVSEIRDVENAVDRLSGKI